MVSSVQFMTAFPARVLAHVSLSKCVLLVTMIFPKLKIDYVRNIG